LALRRPRRKETFKEGADEGGKKCVRGDPFALPAMRVQGRRGWCERIFCGVLWEREFFYAGGRRSGGGGLQHKSCSQGVGNTKWKKFIKKSVSLGRNVSELVSGGGPAAKASSSEGGGKRHFWGKVWRGKSDRSNQHKEVPQEVILQ